MFCGCVEEVTKIMSKDESCFLPLSVSHSFYWQNEIRFVWDTERISSTFTTHPNGCPYRLSTNGPNV